MNQVCSAGFQLETIQYNYERLYNPMESKILCLHDNIVHLKELTTATEQEHEQWLRAVNRRKFAVIISLIRKAVRFSWGHFFIGRLLQVCEHVLRFSVSNKEIPAFFNQTTRLILQEKGITSVTILARKVT